MVDCTVIPSYAFTNLSDSVRQRCNMEKTIYYYILPVILMIGTISNSTVLIVFRRSRYKNMSVGVYMRIYCIMNLLCLYFAYGIDWFTKVAHLPSIESTSDIVCKFFTFIGYVLVFISPWLLVAMVIDRYIAFQHPIHATNLTTSFMAKVTTVIIFVGVFVVCIHALWVATLDPVRNQCVSQSTLHTLIFSWMHALFSQYIPLFLLFVFTILLLTSTFMKTKESRFQSSGNQHTDLVYTVLVLSFMCLILTIPIPALHIVNVSIDRTQYNDDYSAKVDYVTKIVDILAYWNQVIVLFVCLAFSRTFRNEVRNLIGSARKRAISHRRGHNSELKVIASGSSIQCQQDEESANTLL